MSFAQYLHLESFIHSNREELKTKVTVDNEEYVVGYTDNSIEDFRLTYRSALNRANGISVRTGHLFIKENNVWIAKSNALFTSISTNDGISTEHMSMPITYGGSGFITELTNNYYLYTYTFKLQTDNQTELIPRFVLLKYQNGDPSRLKWWVENSFIPDKKVGRSAKEVTTISNRHFQILMSDSTVVNLNFDVKDGRNMFKYRDELGSRFGGQMSSEHPLFLPINK